MVVVALACVGVPPTQALVEVKILAHLRDKDPTDAGNVIHMKVSNALP